MVWWLIKRWRKTPEDYEQELYGRSGEVLEKTARAEEGYTETGEKDPSYRDVLIEEESPKRDDYEEYEEEEEEEESPGGVFISDRKIRGGFKKFGISLLSLSILPWILSFGIALCACVSLIVFPVALSLFPIFLVALFVLAIVAPIVMPLLLIYFLVTEHGKLLINSEGRLFSISFSIPGEEKKPADVLEGLEEAPVEEEYLRPEEEYLR